MLITRQLTGNRCRPGKGLGERAAEDAWQRHYALHRRKQSRPRERTTRDHRRGGNVCFLNNHQAVASLRK